MKLLSTIAAIALMSSSVAMAQTSGSQGGAVGGAAAGAVGGALVGGPVGAVIGAGAGVSDGLRMGQNAKAAFITRGLAEMCRLGTRLGARAETIWGVAGGGAAAKGWERFISWGRAVGPGDPGALVVASHGEDSRRALVETGAAAAAGAGVDVGGPGDAAVDAVRGRGADRALSLPTDPQRIPESHGLVLRS